MKTLSPSIKTFFFFTTNPCNLMLVIHKDELKKTVRHYMDASRFIAESVNYPCALYYIYRDEPKSITFITDNVEGDPSSLLSIRMYICGYLLIIK